MTHNLFDHIVADAVTLYKYILKNKVDHYVIIISVGFLNNLYEFLKDSERYDLLQQKIKLLAVLGGLNNDGFYFT